MDNKSPEHRLVLIDQIEAIYLKILRWIGIFAATLMLFFALWNGLSSLIDYMQSFQSAKVEPVAVSQAEIIAAATKPNLKIQRSKTLSNEIDDKIPQSVYDLHAKEMYTIWKKHFEPFRPNGDPTLTFEDFSEWYRQEFVNGTLRKHKNLDWLADDDATKRDLEISVKTLKNSATDPTVVARMRAFQSSKSGDESWDRYDQMFMKLNDAYWVTLNAKRESEIQRADAQQRQIAKKSENARISFDQARNYLLGFLALMFFFLIVAIERHQRHIAAEVAAIKLRN